MAENYPPLKKLATGTITVALIGKITDAADMIEIRHLLSLADAYQLSCHVEDKTLSSRVFGDSKKLGAMRSGADITTARFNMAIGWFSANWPADTAWPRGIPRPANHARAS